MRWRAGFRNRRLHAVAVYNHASPEPAKGVYRAYFENGRVEIEANYVNGKLHGERKVWYPDGVLRASEKYINDSLDGKARWFHPNGQIYTEKYFSKGRPCNVYRVYDMNAGKRPAGGLIPRMEVVYDAMGRGIVMRNYYKSGRIEQETFVNHEGNTRVVIFYYERGSVRAIEQYRGNELYGNQQRFGEDGLLEKGGG